MSKKPIKPFITYADQINILTQKKQLNISDLSYVVSKLFNTFSTATSVIQKSKLLQAMHFPSNLTNITRYKL